MRMGVAVVTFASNLTGSIMSGVVSLGFSLSVSLPCCALGLNGDIDNCCCKELGIHGR